MIIRENVSLKQYNAFGVDAVARHFAVVEGEKDLRELLQHPVAKGAEILVLGGGSNILFSGVVNKLVVRNNLKGKVVVEEDAISITLRVASGENWHDFVTWTVLEKNWGGLENLALIPGLVGGAPVQNIGAYGGEVKDYIASVEALELNTGVIKSFSNDECQFQYRDSFFKREGKGNYFITAVTFKLVKDAAPRRGYDVLEQELSLMQIMTPTIQDVYRAVVAIRTRKLPDPKVIGNAGSFFKNPIVSKNTLAQLQEQYPDVVHFSQSDDTEKLSAAWLIEQSGWKGKRIGNVGVHDRQALVLVNYGNGTGQEILDLARMIEHDVREKFGINLEPEVNIV